MKRSASINFEQQPNGYWMCAVTVWAGGHCHEQRAFLFHDAAECMEWARFVVESFVATV
jgi:hypothetical protein